MYKLENKITKTIYAINSRYLMCILFIYSVFFLNSVNTVIWANIDKTLKKNLN